jgi:hypothetical protein
MDFENARIKRGRESISNNSRSSDASSVIKTNKKPARNNENEEYSDEEDNEDHQGTSNENDTGNENKQDRLPAVKILIRHSVVPQYTAPRALLNEIMRCKKINPAKIKFANLKGCIITIATDDKDTHQELTREWCQDAFTEGTIFATPRKELQSTIVIKGFPFQADLETEDIEDLQQQGIIDPIKVFNKKTQQYTSLLKAKTSNQMSLEAALKNGVKIGFTIYKVEHEKKVHQCYKCQKFGHSANECRNQTQVCPKCTGDHSLKDCTANVLKCANCNGNHPSFSRSCQFIKDPKATQKQHQQQTHSSQPSQSAQCTNQGQNHSKSYASVVSSTKKGHHLPAQRNQDPVQLNSFDIEQMIQKQLQAAIETLTATLRQAIQDQITEQLQDTVKEMVNQCFEEIKRKHQHSANQQSRATNGNSQENTQTSLAGKSKNFLPSSSHNNC